MIARMTIAGPDVHAFTQFLTEHYGWAFREVQQTSTMSGYAVGWHPNPEEFEGIGINDGTYCKGVEIFLDENE